MVHNIDRQIIIATHHSILFTNVAAAFWAPEFEQSSLTSADQQGHHGRRKSSQGVDGVTL